jgi:hypothetical protein
MTQNQFIVLVTTLRHDIAADLDRRANELAAQRAQSRKFTKTERASLYIAEQALRVAARDTRLAHEFHAYNRDLALRVRDGQVGSGMKHR